MTTISVPPIDPGAQPNLEAKIEYLAWVGSPGFLSAALEEFLPVLLFAVAVLAIGRISGWPATYLPIPILGWSYKMSLLLEELEFNYEPYHLELFLVPFLEGLLALAVVLAFVAVAGTIARSASTARTTRPTDRAGRLERFAWLSALLAVATIALDWAFLVLLYAGP